MDIRKISFIIGRDEEVRKGIVRIKTFIAKKFEIKTGEPLYIAIKKCKQIKVYQSDFLYIKIF